MRRRVVSALGAVAVVAAMAAPLVPMGASANGLNCGGATVSSVTPKNQTVGQTAFVNGSGFSGCNVQVTIGPASVTIQNVPSSQDGQVPFTVAAGMNGQPQVTVSNTLGGTGAVALPQLFAITPTASLSTTSAPEGGAVAVGGSGFLMGSLHPSATVTFGGCNIARAASVTSDGALSTTAPGAYCSGAVGVTFTAQQNGQSLTVSLGNIGSFTTAVGAVTGPSGPVSEGGTFAVSGSGFGSSGSASPWSVASWSDTRIVVAAPSADAVSGTVSLTRADGRAVWSGGVQVASAVSAVSPSAASVGDTVTVSGSGFGPSAGSVSVGGTALSGCSWSHSQITCTVPSGMPPGGGTLTVSPAGNLPSSGAFAVLPRITGVNPTHTAPGSVFEIDGTSFGTQQGSVTVGGQGATVTLWADTQIIVTMPSGLGRGTATVSVSVPNAPSPVTTSIGVDAAPAGHTGSAPGTPGSTPGSTSGSTPGSTPGSSAGFIAPSPGGPIIASGPVDFKPQKQSGPVQLNLKPQSSSGDPGADVPFTVTLAAFGKPVAGAPVDLVLVVVPGTDATITPTHGVTDANGTLSGVLHLSGTPGDHIILAKSGQYSDEIRVVGRGAGSSAAPAVATGRDAGASSGAGGSPQRMLILAALLACVVLFVGGFALNLATRTVPADGAAAPARVRRGGPLGLVAAAVESVRRGDPLRAVTTGAMTAAAVVQFGLAMGACAIGAVVGSLRRA